MQMYKLGTTLFEILWDGWSRDFDVTQTLREANAQGFPIDISTVAKVWKLMDLEYETENL